MTRLRRRWPGKSRNSTCNRASPRTTGGSHRCRTPHPKRQSFSCRYFGPRKFRARWDFSPVPVRSSGWSAGIDGCSFHSDSLSAIDRNASRRIYRDITIRSQSRSRNGGAAREERRSADDCDRERREITCRTGMRIGAADRCRTRERRRRNQIRCTDYGAMCTTDCIAEFRSCPGRQDQQPPELFSHALACDWSAWSGRLAGARATFVIGRGFGLAAAQEIALKIAETLQLPAFGYSAAELRHGPLASASAETPLLVLRQSDETSSLVDDLIASLRARKLNVFSIGGAGATLPWIEHDDPICDAIAMLLPAYVAIEKAARDCGLDPDNPPHLTKITETL